MLSEMINRKKYANPVSRGMKKFSAFLTLTDHQQGLNLNQTIVSGTLMCSDNH